MLRTTAMRLALAPERNPDNPIDRNEHACEGSALSRNPRRQPCARDATITP